MKGERIGGVLCCNGDPEERASHLSKGVPDRTIRKPLFLMGSIRVCQHTRLTPMHGIVLDGVKLMSYIPLQEY